jgi:hypothetical protein
VTFEDDYNSVDNFNENSIKALLINSWSGVAGPEGATQTRYSSTTSQPTSGTTSSIND